MGTTTTDRGRVIAWRDRSMTNFDVGRSVLPVKRVGSAAVAASHLPAIFDFRIALILARRHCLEPRVATLLAIKHAGRVSDAGAASSTTRTHLCMRRAVHMCVTIQRRSASHRGPPRPPGFRLTTCLGDLVLQVDRHLEKLWCRLRAVLSHDNQMRSAAQHPRGSTQHRLQPIHRL